MHIQYVQSLIHFILKLSLVAAWAWWCSPWLVWSSNLCIGSCTWLARLHPRRSLVALLLTISIPIRSLSPPIYVEDLQGRRYMDFYGNSCRQPSSDLAVLPSAVFW